MENDCQIFNSLFQCLSSWNIPNSNKLIARRWGDSLGPDFKFDFKQRCYIHCHFFHWRIFSGKEARAKSSKDTFLHPARLPDHVDPLQRPGRHEGHPWCWPRGHTSIKLVWQNAKLVWGTLCKVPHKFTHRDRVSWPTLWKELNLRIIIQVFIILVHHILKLLMRQPNYVNEEKMSRAGFYSASLIPTFYSPLTRRFQTTSNWNSCFIFMIFSSDTSRSKNKSKNY